MICYTIEWLIKECFEIQDVLDVNYETAKHLYMNVISTLNT